MVWIGPMKRVRKSLDSCGLQRREGATLGRVYMAATTRRQEASRNRRRRLIPPESSVDSFVRVAIFVAVGALLVREFVKVIIKKKVDPMPIQQR